MYDDDLEGYESEVTSAISKLLLNKVFMKLERNFTVVDFAKSFKKVFSKDLEYQTVMDALSEAMDLDLVSQCGEDTFEFNGIFIDTEDWN